MGFQFHTQLAMSRMINTHFLQRTCMIRDSKFGIAISPWDEPITEESTFRSEQSTKIFLLSKISEIAVGPSQFAVRWVTVIIFPALRRSHDTQSCIQVLLDPVTFISLTECCSDTFKKLLIWSYVTIAFNERIEYFIFKGN
jgi:hypothetical protein